MKKKFIISLMLVALPVLKAHKPEMPEHVKKQVEKVIHYCTLCDKKEIRNKNIIIQPIISMIIAKKNDVCNALLTSENNHNHLRYIKHNGYSYDILDNINVVLLIKYVAELYNNDLVHTIDDMYIKCYKKEFELREFISKIRNNDFDKTHILTEQEVFQSFDVYLDKLVKDISE